MTSNASHFIQNRKRIFSVTDGRIKSILWYIVECYQIFKKDNITYSKSQIKENSTIPFENYLKFELIDNYLVKNKHLLKEKLFPLENINFSAEIQKRYIDNKDGKEKPAKIDVFINKLGLNDEWQEKDENVYFSIECKRIEILSDTSKYIEDIEKFTNRDFTTLRLPFEGQIAFIENKSISHTEAVNSINSRLEKHATIKTDSPLTYSKIYNTFEGSYLSKHRKNSGGKEPFSIYHLMFDYSDIVID